MTDMEMQILRAEGKALRRAVIGILRLLRAPDYHKHAGGVFTEQGREHLAVLEAALEELEKASL